MLARREIAEALGVSQQSVSRWINGETAPKAEHFRRLAEVLDINPITLLTTRRKPKNER